MITCPQCGYDKNLDQALCCNLCGKIFKKTVEEVIATPKVEHTKDSDKGKQVIASLSDLPVELQEKLKKEKSAIVGKMDDSLGPNEVKKGCLFIGIALLGFGALIILYLLLRSMINK